MDKQILLEGGIDYNEGLKRFSGNEKLYEKYIVKFVTDTTFSELKQYMEEEDFEGAFRAAHNLKGLAGNLSINCFCEKICPLVEELRNQTDVKKAAEDFPEIEVSYEKALDIIRQAIA